MATKIKLSLNPDKEKIVTWFPFFHPLGEDLKNKIAAAWERIDESDYVFLSDLFKSKDLKVKLDDIGYIYNYFEFLFRVSKSDFNRENELVDETHKELWSFFQMVEKGNNLNRISIQTKDNTNIKITSEYGLRLFYEVFDHSIKRLSGMVKAKNYLLEMKKIGYLNGILKTRSGDKIDYVGTVLKLSVTMFKNYLNNNSVSERNTKTSMHALIGRILAHIGFIEVYNEDLPYITESEYYNKTTSYLDLDISLKKTTRIKDELFPPQYLIYLNDTLI